MENKRQNPNGARERNDRRSNTRGEGRGEFRGEARRPGKPFPREEKRAPRKVEVGIERMEGLEDKRENGPDPDSMILGRNAVFEAFKVGHPIECIYVQRAPWTGSLGQLVAKAKELHLLVKEVSKQKLDEMCGYENHQGIIAIVQAYPYTELEDILARSQESGKTPFLVLCESIQDPHNLGAIIRTAEACGVTGIIISKHHAVGLNASVAKTAAGGLEYVPVAKVTNMAQTIEYLKKQNIWVAAADMDGEVCWKANLTGPMALVIGGEHEGVSRLVREKCDLIVKLPMQGQINSLNASVAAGALMFEVLRQRSLKG